MCFEVHFQLPEKNPKNKLDKRTPIGCDLPKLFAAIAIYPRPEVIFCINNVTVPIERRTQSNPHNIPDKLIVKN